MVTYGGMSKKPITVSTSSFIFKVSYALFFPSFFLSFFLHSRFGLLFVTLG